MFKRLFFGWLMASLFVLNAASPTYEDVTKLYVATFDRAPDADGIRWWVNSGYDLTTIAHRFFYEPETKKKYPESLDNGEFVEAIYNNLFNRDPDPEGFQWWVDQLDSGNKRRENLILDAINGAGNKDAVILSNKTEVGMAYAEAGLGGEHASEVMEGVGYERETVETALAKIDVWIAEMSDIVKGIDKAACSEQISVQQPVYVSTTGSDSDGDGSMEKPYRTIFHAVEVAKSGDTILVRGGTYTETREIRVRVPDVTIRSYPGEWAIVDRRNSGNPDEDDWDSGIYIDVDADRTHIECIDVAGGFYTISTETKWQWGDPADRGGPEGVTLKNVKAHDSYADAIKIKPQSNDFTVEHCEIFDTGRGQDPNDCNAEGVDNVNADRTIVRFSYIHHTCSTGLYFKGGSKNCIAEHNLIENSGEGGILLGFDTSPEYFDMEGNPQMYEAIEPTARYNLIIGSGGAGIGLFATKNAKVNNNTVVDSGSRFHNPLYFGITYQDWDESAVRPPNVSPEIYGNVFAQRGDRSIPILDIRHSDDLGGLSGLDGKADMRHNCYHIEGREAIFRDQRFETQNGYWEGGLEDWKKHMDSDMDSIEANPGFDENFHTDPNSPCAGMGYR